MTALGSIKHLYTIVEKYIYTDSWQAESQGKSWPWALRLQNYNHNIKSVNQNKIVNLYMKSTIKVHREKNIFFFGAVASVSSKRSTHYSLYHFISIFRPTCFLVDNYHLFRGLAGYQSQLISPSDQWLPCQANHLGYELFLFTKGEKIAPEEVVFMDHEICRANKEKCVQLFELTVSTVTMK